MPMMSGNDKAKILMDGPTAKANLKAYIRSRQETRVNGKSNTHFACLGKDARNRQSGIVKMSVPSYLRHSWFIICTYLPHEELQWSIF